MSCLLSSCEKTCARPARGVFWPKNRLHTARRGVVLTSNTWRAGSTACWPGSPADAYDTVDERWPVYDLTAGGAGQHIHQKALSPVSREL